MHACRRCCSRPRLLSHKLARDRWVRHVAGSSGRSDSLPVEETVLTTSVPSLPVAFAPLGLKYLEEHELRRSFDAYDTNGNGLINAHEARRHRQPLRLFHASSLPPCASSLPPHASSLQPCVS